MPCSKKQNKLRISKHFNIMLFSCLSLFYSNHVMSEGTIKVASANSYFKQGYYRINADINYQLSDNAKEALEHGVSLHFLLNADIYQKRNWLWDKKIHTEQFVYHLDYHPLSERYLVSREKEIQREDFQSLQAALNFLGIISNEKIVNKDLINPEKNYFIELKIKLDIKSLPGPLQPLTLFSSEWNLSSLPFKIELETS